MRVLHVIAEMGAGGAEALVADLALHRLGRGDEVTVASSGGWRADRLAAAGVRLVHVPLQRRSAARTAITAVRLGPRVRRDRPDLVHAHNVGATVLAHLAARWPSHTRPPLLATVHGLVASDHARAAGILARTADLVVAVSEPEAEALRRNGFPATRLRVVDNAVPPATTYDRAAVRAALDLPDGVPVALAVTRLAPPKRPDLLVAAWHDVPPPAVLLIAGSGPLPVPLHERVRMLGAREDVGMLLAAADVFCLASDSEGMPMAVLEAMAAGVPVVASAVGGLVTGAAGAAALVPPGDPAALAKALTELLGDPDRRAALAAAGRERVTACFSADAMHAAYDALYAELVSRSVT